MANTYYDSTLGDSEIEAALEAVDGLIDPANNGKVVAVENGSLVAKSVTEYMDVPTLVSKTITANGTYDPADDSADGYSSVTVNVSGGGSGAAAIAINVRAQAYIGSTSNVIVWENQSYSSYMQFWIDLLPYQGKTITITNTGNRNFYGFTLSEPTNGLGLNASRVDSGGTLSVTYDGGSDRYLVYDFSTVFGGGELEFSIAV